MLVICQVAAWIVAHRHVQDSKDGRLLLKGTFVVASRQSQLTTPQRRVDVVYSQLYNKRGVERFLWCCTFFVDVSHVVCLRLVCGGLFVLDTLNQIRIVFHTHCQHEPGIAVLAC